MCYGLVRAWDTVWSRECFRDWVGYVLGFGVAHELVFEVGHILGLRVGHGLGFGLDHGFE